LPLEKATALVLRTTDWSETSRIATLWTREFGKVRVLAKGGRRLKSNFENALDLLTLCSIVFIRKSSTNLDLLTEARVLERFPRLRSDLPALYSAYYLAELLSDWTQDYDPHPILFDEAVAALRDFGSPGQPAAPRLAQFELALLRELGYSPALSACAGCGTAAVGDNPIFSPAAGGILCRSCAAKHRDGFAISPSALRALEQLSTPGAPAPPMSETARGEVRKVLDAHVTYSLGRKPKLLAYLGS
jgi:DNA repair protein RecO (recombination protein O)